MVTYRGVACSNRVGTQQMMQPSFKLEFKRDSKAARAEAFAMFSELLAKTLPDTGATAHLTFTSARGDTDWLAQYKGQPTARTRYRSDVVSGIWTNAKGETVQAGIPANDPRLESYIAMH